MRRKKKLKVAIRAKSNGACRGCRYMQDNGKCMVIKCNGGPCALKRHCLHEWLRSLGIEQ